MMNLTNLKLSTSTVDFLDNVINPLNSVRPGVPTDVPIAGTCAGKDWNQVFAPDVAANLFSFDTVPPPLEDDEVKSEPVVITHTEALLMRRCGLEPPPNVVIRRETAHSGHHGQQHLGAAVPGASAVLIWLQWGWSQAYAIYGNGGEDPTPEAPIWALYYVWLDSNYCPLKQQVGTGDASQPKAIFLKGTSNMERICGAESGLPNDNMDVQRARVHAMGLRILPQLEVVTDPTETYVTSIIGGSLSMQSLMNNLEKAFGYPSQTDFQQVNLYDLVFLSNGAKRYANNEGCCSRYNPFQNDLALQMTALPTLSTVNTSGYQFPAVVVSFSKVVNSGFVPPFYLDTAIWFQAENARPTWRFDSATAADPSWIQLKQIMADTGSQFPYVVSGHTFGELRKSMGQFRKLVDDTYGVIRRTEKDIGQQYRSGKRAYKSVRQGARKGKKKVGQAKKAASRAMGKVASGPNRARRPLATFREKAD